jgi:hypothetical protein
MEPILFCGGISGFLFFGDDICFPDLSTNAEVNCRNRRLYGLDNNHPHRCRTDGNPRFFANLRDSLLEDFLEGGVRWSTFTAYDGSTRQLDRFVHSCVF